MTNADGDGIGRLLVFNPYWLSNQIPTPEVPADVRSIVSNKVLRRVSNALGNIGDRVWASTVVAGPRNLSNN